MNFDKLGYGGLVVQQACQTQTTLRAAKAPKTAKRAAEILKSPEWGTFN